MNIHIEKEIYRHVTADHVKAPYCMHLGPSCIYRNINTKIKMYIHIGISIDKQISIDSNTNVSVNINMNIEMNVNLNIDVIVTEPIDILQGNGF